MRGGGARLDWAGRPVEDNKMQPSSPASSSPALSTGLLQLSLWMFPVGGGRWRGLEPNSRGLSHSGPWSSLPSPPLPSPHLTSVGIEMFYSTSTCSHYFKLNPHSHRQTFKLLQSHWREERHTSVFSQPSHHQIVGITPHPSRAGILDPRYSILVSVMCGYPVIVSTCRLKNH